MSEKRALRISVSMLLALVICLSTLTGAALAANNNDYLMQAAVVALWKKNNDVIGLLSIPGTDTHYPIMEHPTQDDYYLNICFDGTEGYPGSIYTNKVEGKNFDTYNTVIYGHNMRDGSYFGSLKNFRDADYLASHREIDVYTADAKHVYDIFAVVIYNDKRITDYYPDEDATSRQEFLDSLREDGLEGSIFLNDVDVSTQGHILTLSTCISDMHDNRLLIVAAERE